MIRFYTATRTTSAANYYSLLRHKAATVKNMKTICSNASNSGEQTKAPKCPGVEPPVRPMSGITPVFSKVPVAAMRRVWGVAV